MALIDSLHNNTKNHNTFFIKLFMICFISAQQQFTLLVWLLYSKLKADSKRPDINHKLEGVNRFMKYIGITRDITEYGNTPELCFVTGN